jgi:hypothetical protein
MTDEQDDLVFELQELQTEVEENSKTLDNFCNILERNNEKLRKLKQMNHRTPYKPEVQYYDEQMVIVNGVSYTRTQPTPIVIQEDENTIVVGGVKYQRMEDPKPSTLCDTLYVRSSMSSSVCDTVIEIVEKWMSQYECDYVASAVYLQGYNALMNTLKANLK